MMDKQSKTQIENSLHSIEPAPGAKERMLQNIRQKTARQEAGQRSKAGPFRRTALWALPAAACLVLLVAGAGLLSNQTPAATVPTVQGTSPFTSVDSAQEIARQLNIRMDAPEGAESVEYSILAGEIGEVRFMFDGCEYCLRAGTNGEDFSGIQGEESPPEQVDGDNHAQLTTVRSGQDQFIKITWTVDGVTYYLTTQGDSPEAAKGVYTRIVRGE